MRPRSVAVVPLALAQRERTVLDLVSVCDSTGNREIQVNMAKEPGERGAPLGADAAAPHTLFPRLHVARAASA